MTIVLLAVLLAISWRFLGSSMAAVFEGPGYAGELNYLEVYA